MANDLSGAPARELRAIHGYVQGTPRVLTQDDGSKSGSASLSLTVDKPKYRGKAEYYFRWQEDKTHVIQEGEFGSWSQLVLETQWHSR